jgi:hypothetical protein
MLSVTGALVPEKSAATLTNLIIFNFPIRSFFYHNIQLLRPFVNLKYLCIDPPSRSLCQSVADAQFKLRVLSIGATLDTNFDQKSVFTMLSAKSLEYLDEFALITRLPVKNSHMRLEDYQLFELCEQFIQAITKNLQSVQILTIYIPLRISWCRFFAGMTNLRLFRCGVPPDLSIFRDSESYEVSDIEQKKEIEEGFNAAFASFVEKPHVDISISKYHTDFM